MLTPAPKIPTDWTKLVRFSTRTELLEQRKKEKLPDLSFDLDGDGIVSGKDYCIAKRFDLDQDGKLNTEEKAKALAAINEGIEAQFVWGCESSGINRSFRIVQKRGNVILNEEFQSIKNTYPKFPVTQQPNKLNSKTEMIDLRKNEIKLQAKNYEKKIHKEYRKEVENPLAVKNVQSSFRDVYIENPKFKTKNEMLEQKRLKHLEELNSSCNYGHKTQLDRLLSREKKIFCPEGQVITPLLEKLKTQDMQHFSKTFGNRPIGVHGKELPKFADNLQEYLSLSKVASSHSSEKKLEIINSAKTPEPLRPSKEKQQEIVKKPTEIELLENHSLKEYCRNSRWTTYHYKFLQKSAFDCEKPTTKSITPDVNSKVKAFKMPKSLITQRMLKKGTFSPGKLQLQSSGFTS